MELPLGFKIPVNKPTFASAWPDVFSFGEAVYRSTLTVYLEDPYLGDSATAVMSMDMLWLQLVRFGSGCLIHHDLSSPSSVRGMERADAVIVKGGVMVGKCVATYTQTEMPFTTIDMTSNLPPAASCVHSRLDDTTAYNHLHRLSYQAPSFRTTHLKRYCIRNERGRVDFIVDLFKIIKWVCAIEEPNVSMHLIPGIRTMALNGHCVTWNRTGLVKEFCAEATEIDMALIQRIYSANLPHVERGYCKGNTVTITSVGRTLRDAKPPRAVILAQVRAALDELHGIDVAHCDVRAVNLFVLEDKSVILGDLEYCRPVDAPPPRVCCFPEEEPCKTAVELDEYQFRVLSDELTDMGI